MKDKRISDHRRGRPHRLAYRRPRRTGAAARDRHPRQFRARPPGQSARAAAAAPVTIIEGDIRDRALLAKIFEGIDIVFHQAAIRITQCAEEPRLAFDVLAGGTFDVLEAAVDGRRLQGGRCFVGLGAWAGRELSDDRSAPPLQQPHDLWRGQGVQRGAAAQLCRDVRPATMSRCGTSTSTGRAWTFMASIPRCSSAGWSASRPASPRSSSAMASDTMDFVHVRDIARANVLAAKSDVTDEVFNVASGTETSLLTLAQTLIAHHGLVAGAAVCAGAQGKRGAAAAGRHQQGQRPSRVRGPDVAGGRPCAIWWRGGAQRTPVAEERPHEQGAHPDPRRQARPRRARSRGRPARRPVRLGHAGAGGRRLRTRVRSAGRRPSRVRRLELHDGASSGADGGRRRRRATR